MPTESLEIVYESLRIQCGRITDERRTPGATLVVENQRMSPGERLEVGCQVIHGEPRTAMHDDQGIRASAEYAVTDLDGAARIESSLARCWHN
jgi:hypothetical protein